jgi:DNA repair exonuclease SbcCD nuclease subunit
LIYITGDTHIPIDIHKLSTRNFPIQSKLTKDDYVIIAGDFGGVWYNPSSDKYKEDLYWQNWLADKNFTILFVDGNHENHPLLNQLPLINMFGGKVGKVNDSIYHLKRGEIYAIDNKTIFTFGGAVSVDKESRIDGISWWEEEVASYQEMDYGIEQLKKYNNEVDYIITHCCSTSTQNKIDEMYTEDIMTKYFQYIEDNVKFKHWFFGHYHDDIKIDGCHTCLYGRLMGI